MPEPQSEDELGEITSTRDWRMDPELKTMSAMLRLLDDLPDLAQTRVVAWLWSRFAEGRGIGPESAH